jgi:hypothetical protein
VEAWLLPVFRYDSARTQRHLYIRLSTLLTDRRTALFDQLEAEIHHTVNEQFIDALKECLPQLSRDTLRWRLYFVIAATAVATRGEIPGIQQTRRAGGKQAGGIYRNLQPLIAFAEAGFRAPETAAEAPPPKKCRPRATGGKSRVA